MLLEKRNHQHPKIRGKLAKVKFKFLFQSLFCRIACIKTRPLKTLWFICFSVLTWIFLNWAQIVLDFWLKPHHRYFTWARTSFVASALMCSAQPQIPSWSWNTMQLSSVWILKTVGWIPIQTATLNEYKQTGGRWLWLDWLWSRLTGVHMQQMPLQSQIQYWYTLCDNLSYSVWL